MNNADIDVSDTLVDQVANWMKQAALRGEDLHAIVVGTCNRLEAAGLPLARAHLSFSMLHPLYDASTFTWMRGKETRFANLQTIQNGAPADSFVKSPYYHLISNNLDYLRRRLDFTPSDEFPVFEDLRKLGVTDYLAFSQYFDSAERGMLGSWATDATGGFNEDMIKALLRIQGNLAMAARIAVLGKLGENMLTTYVGGDAGKRVLSGQIRRGDGETVRAILVMGDMRESTKLAERSGRQTFIDTLNDFFDAIAMPFNRNGGGILNFIGDGFLAVYPCDRHRGPSEIAAQAAMSAVRHANARMVVLNDERKKLGLDTIGFGLGLHVGNVMYGNVGLENRLTFSAFGSAVNEVQRLESLTKKFGQPVVASDDFVDYCGGEWELHGEEKLRGINEKVPVYLPGPSSMKLKDSDAFVDGTKSARSDAEEVMKLIQDRKQFQQTEIARTPEPDNVQGNLAN